MENITVTPSDFSIIVATPHDLYFCSEVEVQLHNFRKFNMSQYMQILVYETEDVSWREYWDKLAQRYAEVSFFFYSIPGLKNLLTIYPQVCRPSMLRVHYQRFPEMKDKVIWYIDSDVLLTKPIDFTPWLKDDICYLSSTPYIGADYFASKRNDVWPFKLELYDQRDILKELCDIVGIDKQVVIDNNTNTGGCQYLLKGIDSSFWEDVEKNCVELRFKALNLNAEFFPSENKGLQSWAIGDMCGLLWNLWKRNIEVRCPSEFDFSWASSPIEKYDQCSIFHNAGISGIYQEMDGKKHRMFHKGDIRFRTSVMTFFDITEWGEITTDYCTYKYVEAIKEVEDPICITKSIKY